MTSHKPTRPDRDIKSRKLQLLLTGLTSSSLNSKIHGKSDQPSAKETDTKRYHRWCAGMVIPLQQKAPSPENADQRFLQRIGLHDFLNTHHASMAEMVEAALAIRRDKLDHKPAGDRKALEAQYVFLFQQDDNRYEPIRTKNAATNPYYQARHDPRFLETHLDSLAVLAGDNLVRQVRERLLRVTIPAPEQGPREVIFPAVNLLPSGSLPSLDDELDDEHSLIQVPEQFLEAVRGSGSKIEDNPTFAVQSLDLQTGRIHCFTSSYYRAIFQCDKHFYQIAAQFPGLEGDSQHYRENAHLQDWAEQLRHIVVDNDFSTIEASLGCACLVIHNTPKGYRALLCKKAQDANGMHDAHVVPALMFQPIGNNPMYYKDELNILWQVLRELAEELFGVKEFSADVHPDRLYQQVIDQPEIAHINDMLQEGKAEFHVTGLYLDLFRLRPEIVTTLIIHDPEWYETHIPSGRVLGNWEIAPKGVFAIHMEEMDFFKAIKGKTGYLCAPGAAAYVEGYYKFQQVMKRREPLST